MFLIKSKNQLLKRKLSAVNQFCFIFINIKLSRVTISLVLRKSLCRKSTIKNYWTYPLVGRVKLSQGRLIALLIVEMGLLLIEILQLKIVDIELDFQVFTVRKKKGKKAGLAARMLLGVDSLLTGFIYLIARGKLFTSMGLPSIRVLPVGKRV